MRPPSELCACMRSSIHPIRQNLTTYVGRDKRTDSLQCEGSPGCEIRSAGWQWSAWGATEKDWNQRQGEVCALPPSYEGVYVAVLVLNCAGGCTIFLQIWLLACRIITVPVGTCIARSIDPSEEDFDADDFTDFDAESPSESGISQEAAVKQPAYGDANNMIMADLDTHAARFLIARGGLGGRGSITTSRWEDDARCVSESL